MRTAEDARRTAFLESRGYRVLRFWNNEIRENMEGVLAMIEGALKDMPSPSPSRHAGGEKARSAEGEGL